MIGQAARSACQHNAADITRCYLHAEDPGSRRQLLAQKIARALESFQGDGLFNRTVREVE